MDEFSDQHPARAHLVDEAREISDELGNQQTEPRGVLRLATTSLFAENLLPELMTRYLAANPKVRVEVLSSTDRLDLTTERIDVAIRSGPIEDLATWTSKRLRAATTVGLYASASYLKRRGSPANVEALAEHELLVSTTRPAGTQWVVQRRPSSNPASPKAAAPVQTEAKCAPAAFASRSQSITGCAIKSCPGLGKSILGPGTITRSSARGLGRGSSDPSARP